LALVALDYDGVIADTNRVKSAWIARELGMDVPPGKCDRTRCTPIIGEEPYTRMSHYVYDREASLAAQPVPGALQGIAALRRAHRLAIVTARRGNSVDWAREWLARHGIADAFEDILSSHERVKVKMARELGAIALVDDDARHLRPHPEIEIVRLHYSPFPGSGVGEPGIVTVADWAGIVGALRADRIPAIRARR